MNCANVSQTIQYFRYNDLLKGENQRFLSKILKLNSYVRFGRLKGVHSQSLESHLVMKILNILPNGERAGFGRSDLYFTMGDEYLSIFKDMVIITKNWFL